MYCDYYFKKNEDEGLTSEEYPLLRIKFEENVPREEGKLPTLKIIYWVDGLAPFKEWICPQHSGFARERFVDWWDEKTSCPIPSDVATAKRYIDAGALSTPKKIKVTRKPADKFPRIEWLDFTRVENFDPAASLTSDDWDVKKNCQDGFPEFSQFSEEKTEDPLKHRRCGECLFFSPAVYCDGEQPDGGGFCDKVSERTNFYDRECRFFKEDPKQTIIPEF